MELARWCWFSCYNGGTGMEIPLIGAGSPATEEGQGWNYLWLVLVLLRQRKDRDGTAFERC